VAHHGSSTSSTDTLLSVVSPDIAVISVGAGNPYGHPSDVILHRLRHVGASVQRTDLQGSIVVQTDGTVYSVDPQRGILYYLPLGLRS
jgi:competence protein ComEC